MYGVRYLLKGFRTGLRNARSLAYGDRSVASRYESVVKGRLSVEAKRGPRLLGRIEGHKGIIGYRAYRTQVIGTHEASPTPRMSGALLIH